MMSRQAGGRALTIMLTVLVAAVGVAVVIGVAAMGWALIR